MLKHAAVLITLLLLAPVAIADAAAPTDLASESSSENSTKAVFGGPTTQVVEAWFGELSGVAIFAQNLEPNASCELHAIREDGEVCFVGHGDAYLGSMSTNAGGTLVTSYFNHYENSPMLRACLGGFCTGFIALAGCNPPVTTFRLVCGEGSHDIELTGPWQMTDPPSAALGLTLPAPPASAGHFDLVAGMSYGHIDAIPQCSVRVETLPDDSPTDVLNRAADAVNSSLTCGITAELDTARGTGPPRLRLSAPDRSGTQLIPGVHVEPGQADGRCFSLGSIGVPESNQARVMAIDWTALPGGLLGGTVTLVEHSPVGSCSVTVPTFAGLPAFTVASALRDAFFTTGIPGPLMDCEAAQNPRDVTREFAQNRTTLATELEVCVNDPGVGFALRPAGYYGANPIARCEEIVTDCTGSYGADVLLDASQSSDPNAPAGLPDDGLTFFWYEHFGQPEQKLIGQGRTLPYRVPTGQRDVGLVILDAEGLVDVTTCAVNVTDTEFPTVSAAIVTPDMLSPPNHEMVDVSVYISAYDTCGDTIVELRSVRSGEPDDAPGPTDGSTVLDIQNADLNTADFDIRLRAERDESGPGRTYELLYDVRDEVYNTQTIELIVEVPFGAEGEPDPIELTLDIGASPGTVLVEWDDSANDDEYDVVRGDIGRITPGGEQTHMGPIDCLAVGTGARRVVDTDATDPGEAKFFLVSAVRDAVLTGYTTTGAVKPRYVTSCRIEPPVGGPVQDPERNSIVPTAWGWLLGQTGAAVGEHLERFGERLVDVDRLGPDQYQTVQVTNGGSTYGTPAYWFNGLTSAEVFVQRFNLHGRILDVEPYVDGDQTKFTVSMIPNEGKREKTWWWDYDLTGSEIAVAIDANNMRLIDIEVYEKDGLTRFAYVGILNEGVDAKPSWPIYNATFEELGEAIDAFGARLIDIEIRPDGNYSAVLVANDGTHWWWGAGLTAEVLGSFVDNKAARLVDIERQPNGTYAFVSIDNVSTTEGRRLRDLLDQVYADSVFGGNTRRGLLVKEVNGPILAEVGGGMLFNPASTLKLLPYLYAIQEVDRGNATLDSEVEWWDQGGDCFEAGVGNRFTAPFRDALPTMMWFSHNKTLEAFFDLYPPNDPDPDVETLTSRAQGEWGMADTQMFVGCPSDVAPWLANRSTLRDIATLYEGVANETFFGAPLNLGRKLFLRNMINIIEGSSCPGYVDPEDCVGRSYSSPYLAATVGAPDVSFMTGTVIGDEAPAGMGTTEINQFKSNVIIRGKGGGTDDGITGLGSDSLFVTIPFKDGGNAIVPKNYVIAFYFNEWDSTCGNADNCDDLRNAADAAALLLKNELFREMVRRAWATW